MKNIAYQAFLGSNYGTILQTVGLFKKIIDLGYNCELVGCGEFLNRPIPDDTIDQNSKVYDTLITHLTYEQFIYNQLKFDKNLARIPSYKRLNSELEEEIAKYDCFICGSDQIWKPSPFWFFPKYYLQYAPKEKRVAYAPSIGYDKIPFRDIKNIPRWRTWIESVPYRSVREESGAYIIEELIGERPPVVLDPSFLLSADEWVKLLPYGRYSNAIIKQLMSERPYILAYLLDTYDQYKDKIKNFANNHNLEIIWLCGRDNTGPIQLNSSMTDPAGMVNLVKNSSYIFTDGYHGSCFSINFNKPFSALINERSPNITRVGDLFKLLHIDNRFVSIDTNFDTIDYEIDYEPINHKLTEMRNFSIDWLNSSLTNACEAKTIISEPDTSLETIKPKFIRKIKRVPLDDPNNCTGCSACMNMCPTNAITMQPSEYGFLRPVVDDKACIRCGKCLNNCPLRKKPKLYLREKLTKAWALWATDPFTIIRSASGGAFTLMAQWIIEQEGVVYGVTWGDDMVPKTTRATTKEELKPLSGSKYVQATTGYAYKEVKKDLDKGIPVLFSGTSCQVAGLYAFLGSDHDLLITIDLICGGTPAQSVFKSYLQWRETQLNSKLVEISFRSKKESGWGLGGVLKFTNGKFFQFPWIDDEYGILYNNHFIQNTACYVCRFRGIDKRWSDMTIGDFWGIGKQGVRFNYPTKQGISALLPNSIKGQSVLETLKNMANVICVERSLDELLPGNAWLQGNYPKRKDYDILAKLLANNSFESAFNKYFCSEKIRDHIQFES